jgi:ribosomal protein S18 acetylase RimI-like enzyme
MIKFNFAETKEHLVIVQELFLEYATSLGFSLCFQDFDKELAELPGEYVLPDGCLILAMDETNAVGCVALRKIDNDICEMKRLYVKPSSRGEGVGRKLVKAIIEEAEKIGYTYMRLDTVPAMKEAIALYRSMGFYKVEPYRENPIEGALCMELNLKSLPNIIPS